ncbi:MULTISPECIES: hypothetical protein [Priestia]|uniref:hypothetical protein n=1 Tax=Priestia TaxID=2800373 RepID=UPI0021D6936B|nr:MULTISPECIES: hypothetical protein [Priestia]MCU7707733.1 hypothetical protein [Priestia megaterium]MCW1047358.1 hypothetical protein [Priestia sp. JV24]MDQ0806521.1 hypothetical protein [Priestia megaterium]
MKKRQGITLLLFILGAASISFGMALKNIFPYSPATGWILGTLLLLGNSFYTRRYLHRESIKK